MRPIGGGALSNAHTHREGREQHVHKRHRSMHCKRQRDKSKAMGVSTRARDLRSVLTRRTHTHTHPTSPAAQRHSKPAVWPCQMTYDTQHLRPIGGGALSNAHTHREGREQQAHKRHRSMHCKRQRERQIQSTGCQHSSKRLTFCPHQTHTHTHTHPSIPASQQHSSTAVSQPCGIVKNRFTITSAHDELERHHAPLDCLIAQIHVYLHWRCCQHRLPHPDHGTRTRST
eukprot:COSAG06_NODE_11766_length_1467_cov_15.677632_1_plen_229_part_00